MMAVYTQDNGRRNAFVATLFSVCLAVAALSVAVFAPQARAALPAPEVTGLLPGQVITVPDVDIDLAVDESLTGGLLDSFQCSLDGGPFTECASSFSLTGLLDGDHTLEVKAVITLLGGEPVCILTICIDPGPISVETDIAALPFSVDVGGGTGTPGSDGGTGSNGSNGSNGNNGNSATAPAASSSAALARQTTRCNKLRKKLRKSFRVRSNRVRVRKRYMRCLKTKRRLAALVRAGR